MVSSYLDSGLGIVLSVIIIINAHDSVYLNFPNLNFVNHWVFTNQAIRVFVVLNHFQRFRKIKQLKMSYSGSVTNYSHTLAAVVYNVCIEL